MAAYETSARSPLNISPGPLLSGRAFSTTGCPCGSALRPEEDIWAGIQHACFVACREKKLAPIIVGRCDGRKLNRYNMARCNQPIGIMGVLGATSFQYF